MNTSEYKQLNEFNNWILSIGNGNTQNDSVANTDDNIDCQVIQIPDDLLIKEASNKIRALVESTYPDFLSNYKNADYIKNRAT